MRTVCLGFACRLHSSFQFLSESFFRIGFCTLSAPNRVATTKVCENEYCFGDLRVGVVAGGDDEDSILSSQLAISTLLFSFSFRSVYHSRCCA